MSAPSSQTTATLTEGGLLSGGGINLARENELGPLAGFLSEVQRRRASDLLLVAGAPPTIFAAGKWSKLTRDPMSAKQVADCLTAILTDRQRTTLQQSRDLDLGISLPGLGRYRINLHYQQGSMAAAFRAIPETIPAFEQLGLPPGVLRFADYPSGLVLVTGGTGQGKSTTLAALIDHMNHNRASHIITIEDPIEFGFSHGTCIVEQRQIGQDSPTFASALRHILRQRPDVIFIGEMRDPETMATALTAAETGHLVLTTLHTASALQSIARIIDVFPPAQQPQIRTQLAASLRAILCQRLLRDHGNQTLVPATELLIATPAIRRTIRDNETHLIYSMIETGRRHGMHTLEQSLDTLVQAGRVEAEQALAAAADPVHMQNRLGLLLQSSSPELQDGTEDVHGAVEDPRAGTEARVSRRV